MFDTFIPQILEKGGPEIVQRLSERDVRFLLSPPTEVFVDGHMKVIYSVNIVEDKKKQETPKQEHKPQKEVKKRGEGRMYSVEDEKWDMEMREELAKKKARVRQCRLFVW